MHCMFFKSLIKHNIWYSNNTISSIIKNTYNMVLCYGFCSNNMTKDMKIITISESSQIGLRVDRLILKNYDLKWDIIQKALRNKHIFIKKANDQVVHNATASYRLELGDKLLINNHIINNASITPINSIETKADPHEHALFKHMIIEETKDFIAINKLANISSQGGPFHGYNLVHMIKNYHHIKAVLDDNANNDSLAFISNRLDKHTTGIMLIPTNKSFARYYSGLLQNRQNVEKTYIGILQGIPREILMRIKNSKSKLMPRIEKNMLSGVIDNKLIYNSKLKKMCIAAPLDIENGQDCMTEYIIKAIVKFEVNPHNNNIVFKDYRLNPFIPDIENIPTPNKLFKLTNEDFFTDYENNHDTCTYHTIVKFILHGGRKHQIRVHSSFILGIPIILDFKYGFQSSNKIDLTILDTMHKSNIIKGNGLYKEEQEEKEKGYKKSKMNKEKHFVEKFIKDGLKNHSYHYLHSLKVLINDTARFEYKADYPIHFKNYFKYVFDKDDDNGNDHGNYDKYIKNIMDI